MSQYKFTCLPRLQQSINECNACWNKNMDKSGRKASDSWREVSKFMLLPDEMKLHIFSHLSPQDLQAVSATCKDFHRMSQDPSLWTELTMDISESRRTMLWKVAKCPWLNTLKISNKNGIDLKSQHFKIASISRRFQFLKLIWLETGVTMPCGSLVVNSGTGRTG